MRYLLILLFSTILLFSQVTFAQYYDTGQEPSSLRWKQIKTGRFTVIYPEKYGIMGIEYAKSLDEAYSKLVSLFPDRKFNIPVIIHNYTINSNGYVSWAPRRMELYPTPEQNTIPLAPEKQLALHELTHVIQMESLNRGFSKGMSFLLGEQFTGITASLLPLWFLEGDAVFAETALSESGRGRTPSFQKELKAISLEKKPLYKYDKILNGSFRDYIPDHYQYGYQMSTWARAKYDPEIWTRVLDFTARQPFTIIPVNISLFRSARLTKKKLYEEAFDSLKTIWSDEASAKNPLYYDALNPDKNGKFANYYCPVYAGTDSIISIKTSLTDPPAFVLVNPSGRTEKKLHIPGQMYPWYISYAKDKVVWVETESDPRWENRNFSVIKLLDINTNITYRLSRKSRFLAAAISPDGKKISAIENTINNENNLVLLDAETGSVIQSVFTPGNVYLQRPQWSESGEKVISIFLSEQGEGIISYTLADQKWETLIEPGREDLQSVVLRKDSLFYISSKSGTDNVYLQTSDKMIKTLTRSRFGTSDLCLNRGRIYFSDYSSSGNNICTASIKGFIGTDNNAYPSSFLINRIDIKPGISEDNPGKNYTPEPYSKWQHLFRFHSWMPFYADLEEIKSDPTSVRPGISIMSQNQLSTLITSIGYEYSATKNNVVHSRITWKGLYPVFESQISYGEKPGIYKGRDVVANPAEIMPALSFQNTVSVPLTFNNGRFTQYLHPSISSNYRNEYIYIKDEGNYDYGQTIISARIYLSNYNRSAMRDIYPSWAQTIDLNYSYAPFDKKIYGSVFTFKSSFYFPGFLPSNGIKIKFEKEKLNTPKYFFSGNRASLPRGYKNLFIKDIEFVSVDYVLPLAYPDFNLSSLLYLKRIRTSLFYDYAAGPGNSIFEITSNGLLPMYNNANKKSLQSFGFELMTDFHVFRIPYMLSAGVQSAWKNLDEKPSFEFLFNMDLFGLSIGRRRL